MHVVVIGCGLAGVSTAWFLARAGAEVTVVDRAPGPARETSYANGSLLTPSLADPWNAPGVFGSLLTSLGRDDAPMLLHLSEIPRLGGWCIRFLWNARRSSFEASYLANAGLARYSLALMESIRRETDLEFEFSARGIVKVFEDQDAWTEGIRIARWLEQADIGHRVLGVSDLVELEPALAPVAERFAGAIHYPEDQVGNARLYCEELAVRLDRDGVRFLFGREVIGLVCSGGSALSLETAEGPLEGDHFVVAAGSFSPHLGRSAGLRIPVMPAKGYSITVPVTGPMPRIPVIDQALHAAVVPLGDDRLRVAGTAEFAGYDQTVRPERIGNLVRLLGKVYPEVDTLEVDLQGWTGLRPMTPDGRPILGATPVANVSLNTGHGALGWTLAAGSGKVVADAVMGEVPEIDPRPFRFDRF